MLSPAAAAVLLDQPEVAAQIVRRVIEEALITAEPDYWRRRARTFAEVGTSRAGGIAVACASHAVFLEAQRRGVDLVEVLGS